MSQPMWNMNPRKYRMNKRVDFRFVRDRDQKGAGETVQHYAQPIIIPNSATEVLQAKIARALRYWGPPLDLFREVCWRGGDNPTIRSMNGE